MQKPLAAALHRTRYHRMFIVFPSLVWEPQKSNTVLQRRVYLDAFVYIWSHKPSDVSVCFGWLRGSKRKMSTYKEWPHLSCAQRELSHARGAGNNWESTQSSTKQFCGFKSERVELLKPCLPAFSFLIHQRPNWRAWPSLEKQQWRVG